jgi:hypothetical protein
MLAHAILTVIAAGSRTPQPSEDLALMQFTINEIRHRFAKLTTITVHHHDHPLAGLVTLATPTPSTRPDHRLPTPPHSSTCIYIPNPGCRTS